MAEQNKAKVFKHHGQPVGSLDGQHTAIGFYVQEHRLIRSASSRSRGRALASRSFFISLLSSAIGINRAGKNDLAPDQTSCGRSFVLSIQSGDSKDTSPRRALGWQEYSQSVHQTMRQCTLSTKSFPGKIQEIISREIEL